MKIQHCVKYSEVFGARGCCDSPTTTKRDIKHHRTPSVQLTGILEQHSVLYQLLNAAQERNDKWKWYCAYG